jgi:osmotically-inducible protein OsmY
MSDLRTLENLKRHAADLVGGAMIYLRLEDGVVTISGEVEDIIVKRRMTSLAASTHGVRGVVDHLRRRPKQLMADREIRTMLLDALEEHLPFAECRIVEAPAGGQGPARSPRHFVDVDVELGLVRLSGQVPGLDLKRLAGVLAWWIPGTCEVHNELQVIDWDDTQTFGSLAESVRLVLERDPLVDAASIRVGAKGPEVTLAGPPLPARYRKIAEEDAWYVHGVTRVRNLIPDNE